MNDLDATAYTFYEAFVTMYTCLFCSFLFSHIVLAQQAYGAAVQGGILSGDAADATKDVLLLDVAPLKIPP